MRGLRAKRVKMVKEGTLIATVDIGVASNTGYCTTLDGRSTKSFRFDNTKEGFEKFWCMTIVSKKRFGCDEVLVGYESTGPLPNRSSIILRVNGSKSSKSTPCTRRR
jgi:hypothetical protein